MIQPNDILIRETSDGQTVWVSQRMVVEGCGVKEKDLRDVYRFRYKRSLPASWQKVAAQSDFFLGDNKKSWRWGRRNGQYYYDIDRIPNRKPRCYRDMLPGKDELIAAVENANLRYNHRRKAENRKSLMAAVRELRNEEDARWIRLHSGYQLPASTVNDYASALAWCRFIRSVVARNLLDLFGATSIERFYDACAAILSELRLSNFRIGTGESLRKKIASFPQEINEQRKWIISKKYGNSNRKISKPHQIINGNERDNNEIDI
ncbi:hypothetical protein [Alistipes sp.]|nr:MAG TPA: hypothetical protein [Caudoviricetes sp.]